MDHRKLPLSDELAEAMLAQEPPVFHPNTGQAMVGDVVQTLSPSARIGLEVPRYCQICGRRMVVRIRPDGWRATCVRHGELDSMYLDRR